MRSIGHLGFGLILAWACSVAHARPALFEETTKLLSPDPAYTLQGRLALDGNDLLVIGRALDPDALHLHALFHFERQSDGTWLPRGKIDGLPRDGAGEGYFDIALSGGIAAFSAEWRGLHILEKTVNGWSVTGNLPLQSRQYASEVRVVDGTVAVGAEENTMCQIAFLRKNASGSWVIADQVTSPDPECEGGDIDVLGPFAMEYTGSAAVITHSESYIYDLVNGAWVQSPAPPIMQPVAMGQEIARRAGEDLSKGHILYLERRDGAGQWTVQDTVTSEESYADVRPATTIVRGSRAVIATPLTDLRGENSGSVNVYDRDVSGVFRHAATLVSSDAVTLSITPQFWHHSEIAVDEAGLRIAARGTDTEGRSAVYMGTAADFAATAAGPRYLRGHECSRLDALGQCELVSRLLGWHSRLSANEHHGRRASDLRCTHPGQCVGRSGSQGQCFRIELLGRAHDAVHRCAELLLSRRCA